MPWKECSVMDERLRFVALLVGRRGDERGVPRRRHFAQDRLQDLRSIQGAGAGSPDGPFAAAGALRQPTADPDRDDDRHLQAGEAALGGPQDPRAAGEAARPGLPSSSHQYDPCGAAQARPGERAQQVSPWHKACGTGL